MSDMPYSSKLGAQDNISGKLAPHMPVRFCVVLRSVIYSSQAGVERCCMESCT